MKDRSKKALRLLGLVSASLLGLTISAMVAEDLRASGYRIADGLIGRPVAAQTTAGNSISILPSSTISSSATSTPITGLQSFQNAFLEVSVTGVPVGGTPTLDVYLQSSPDGGTTWRDFAHTSQITTSNVNQFVQLSGMTAGATTGLAASDAALAANTVVQGPWGDRLRAKWVFVAGGSSGSYTVAISGVVK
jgi:hypothetical protein